jgi:hypothetical protein
MENLKSVLAALLIEAKPYAIVGGACFVAGIFIGALL